MDVHAIITIFINMFTVSYGYTYVYYVHRTSWHNMMHHIYTLDDSSCIYLYWHQPIDPYCNCQGNTTDANKQQWIVVVWIKDSKKEVDLLPCCQRLGQNQALVKAQMHKYIQNHTNTKKGLRLQFWFNEIHCKPTSLQNNAKYKNISLHEFFECSRNNMFGSSLWSFWKRISLAPTKTHFQTQGLLMSVGYHRVIS